MYEFKLPDLGEGIHEGEILKWHVQAGESIREDAPLVDVETDKAALTIPSPRTGTIVSTSGEIGETVFVGNIIVVIDDGSGEAAASKPAAATAKTSQSASAAAAADGGNHTPASAVAVAEPARASVGGNGSTPPAASWGRVIAAPATRRRARELGIDIRRVPPTGPAGRVTPDDILRFVEGGSQDAQTAPSAGHAAGQGSTPLSGTPAKSKESTSPAYDFSNAGHAAIPFLEIEPLPDFAEFGPIETEAVRSIRRKVARKMVTSMTIVPHVAHMDEIDVTQLDAFRREQRDRWADQPGGRLTLLAFVIKAVTAGLKEFPVFNASLDFAKEEIVYKKYYNVGIAVDTERGLVVPVIRDTDRKSIREISADIERLAEKARAGQLEAADLRGGTITITNVGSLGGTAVVPTINYPEVAIIGMARVQEKPVVIDHQIEIRKMLPFTLAFDHRIADGAQAARFAAGLVRRLSDPNVLMLES